MSTTSSPSVRMRARKTAARQLHLETCEPRQLLAADLAVQITDNGASVSAGGEVEYSIAYENRGDEMASATELIVMVPAASSVNVEASDGDWACEGRECRLELGDVEAGSEGSNSLVLSVSEDLPSNVSRIGVIARVVSSTREFRLRNNVDWSTTPIDRAYHDLRFDITDGGATVAQGGQVTYAIKHSNASDNAAADAVVQVQLPRYATLATEGNDGWTCEESLCSLPLGEVAGNSEGEASITVDVADELPNTVRSIRVYGAISAEGLEASSRNNRDSSKTPISRPEYDLTFDVTDQGAKTSAGETVLYAVTYGNQGTAAAGNATIRVDIPQVATLDAEASEGDWSCEENTCTLSVGDVAADTSGSAVLALRYADELPNRRYFRVHGSIAADSGTERNVRNNRDSSTTPLRSDKYDLSLDLTDNGASVEPGGIVTYTATYKNAGDVTATSPVLTLRLPATATLAAEGNEDGWNCEEGVCTIALPDLAAGESAELAVAVQVVEDLPDDVRSIRVVGSVASETGTDRSTRNNVDASYTPIQRDYHDLAIRITDNGAKVAAGEVVTYEVTWKNRGEHAARGTVLTVEIPEFVTLSEDNSEGWTCDGTSCQFEVGDVEPGVEGSTQIAFMVAEELPGNVNHVRVDAAMAAAEGFDWNPRNNHDPSVTPLVRDYHDLAINFTDRGARTTPGGTVQYFANYRNRGEHTASGSTITVELPEFASFDPTQSSDGWECADGVCTLSVGDVEPGASGEVTLGISVSDELPADTKRIRVSASIHAATGADARTRNNRNPSVTPIEAVEDDSSPDDGSETPVSPASWWL